jgi:hypothetical protein
MYRTTICTTGHVECPTGRRQSHAQSDTSIDPPDVRGAASCGSCRTESRDDTDRGAISLEQVLWFVAVAVSVGVIATILWNRIFDAADDAELDLPEPPGG